MATIRIRTTVHNEKCHCFDCRHDRFNPGPASMSRKKRRAIRHKDAKRRLLK